jgi:hypothetical protein
MPRYIIVAGVDYGTSFTKVVLRDNNTPRSKAITVRFPECPDGLLPSLVGINKDSLLFSPLSNECIQVPYLKMMAANVADVGTLRKESFHLPDELKSLSRLGDDALIIRDLLAFYFAHVIAATEDFIRTNSPWKDFDFTPGGQNDFLIFQLAVPAGLIDDNGASDRLFRDAFIAGYELNGKMRAPNSLRDKFRAVFRRAIPHKKAIGRATPYKEWSDHVNQTLGVDRSVFDSRYEWQCLIYPEVAAAVQTVFRSPNARDGLYITMDVGGGTVDLNAFRRFSGHGKRAVRQLDYYSAIVRPLGIHHLKDLYRVVQPLSKDELMNKLRRSLQELYGRAILKQPNLGVPGRRTWDGATVYIFGGGAHHPIYQRALIEGLKEAGLYSPETLHLPAAQDLSFPKEVEFGRFAVAYGLSFFRPNLDKVTLPRELPHFRELYPQRPPRQYGFNWED